MVVVSTLQQWLWLVTKKAKLVLAWKSKPSSKSIKKAQDKARVSMISAPIQEGTIPHNVVGKYSATKNCIPSRSPWYRCYCQFHRACNTGCGWIQQCSHKGIGSNNPHNVVRATLMHYKSLSPRTVCCTCR